MSSKASAQFQWKIRRRWVALTLAFCAAMVASVAYYGADTQLNLTIVTSSYALATMVLSVYVLGATWDDLNARKFGTPATDSTPAVVPVVPAVAESEAG